VTDEPYKIDISITGGRKQESIKNISMSILLVRNHSFYSNDEFISP
jgi:hypothetical protein